MPAASTRRWKRRELAWRSTSHLCAARDAERIARRRRRKAAVERAIVSVLCDGRASSEASEASQSERRVRDLGVIDGYAYLVNENLVELL